MGSPIAASGNSDSIVFQSSGDGVNTYPSDTASWTIPSDGQSLVVLKQNAIRALFSEDYKELEIIPWNGKQPLRCFPKVLSIEFPEDLWFKICKYKITLEADYLIGVSPDESPTEDVFSVDSGNFAVDGIGSGFDFVSQYSLEEASESFNIEMDTEYYGVFKCNHSISAKGYRSLDTVGNVVAESWQNARSWVNSRTGFSPVFLQSGSFGLMSGIFTNYNHYRTQNCDIYNGQYSVNETWVLSSGNFYEEYSAELKQSVTEPFKTVTVQGTINGLSNFNVGTDAWLASSGLIKYQNASGAWNGSISGGAFLRAQQYIGVPLNPYPNSQTVTHQFNKGIIAYNFEFNNRPLALVSGAISEVLSVIDSNASGLVDTIGVHMVLNRALGPVLQDIGTTPETKRSVSYECVLPAPTYGGSGNNITYLMSLKPREQVNALLSGLTPTNYAPGYLFVGQDEENWSPLTQRYSRQYSWVYERN